MSLFVLASRPYRDRFTAPTNSRRIIHERIPIANHQVRLLRAESEQVKHQNSELKMKTQVELESLQEQLRVRKEKQYQLLEKLQGQEEAKRQAEDQVDNLDY